LNNQGHWNGKHGYSDCSPNFRGARVVQCTRMQDFTFISKKFRDYTPDFWTPRPAASCTGALKIMHLVCTITRNYRVKNHFFSGEGHRPPQSGGGAPSAHPVPLQALLPNFKLLLTPMTVTEKSWVDFCEIWTVIDYGPHTSCLNFGSDLEHILDNVILAPVRMLGSGFACATCMSVTVVVFTCTQYRIF